MPRSINATLEAALASGSYEPYIKLILSSSYTEPGQTTPITVEQVVKYKLTPEGELYVKAVHTYDADNDDNYQRWDRAVLRRGVTISGTDYYIDTSTMWVYKVHGDGNYIYVYANMTQPRNMTISANQNWEDTLTEFCTELGLSAEFKNPTDTFWDNAFFPADRDITINNSPSFRKLLIQKGFVNFCDNGGDELLFYSARNLELTSDIDYEINVEAIVEGIHEITPYISSPFAATALLWQDENGDVFHPTGGGAGYHLIPRHNIGYLETGDTLPTAASLASSKIIKNPITIKPIVIPLNLTYLSGDKVTIISSETDLEVTGYLQVTEYLDLEKSPSWGLIISLWDFITPPTGSQASVINTALDGNLTQVVNSLEELIATINDADFLSTVYQPLDSDLTAIAALSPSNDDILQRKSGAWTNRTIAQLITDLTSGLSALFAPIAKGVTNGDSHDHNGGDGAQIAHGNLSSIGTNTHAQIDTTLAALASTYAPIAKGVTNGDSHDHNGGDGAQISHANLSNIGSNSHSTIDTHLANTSNPHSTTAAQVAAIPNGGWVEVSDSWSYASASTITIPSDGTTVYQKGMKIRIKQGGSYKYYIVASVTSTLITVFITTTTVANSAITNIAYSFIDSPYGWPGYLDFSIDYTGFSVKPTTSYARCYARGDRAYIRYKQVAASLGTSNATTFTLTGFPVAIAAADVLLPAFAIGVDNGAALLTPCRMDLSSTTLTLYKDASGAAWTNSGSKGLYNLEVNYQF